MVAICRAMPKNPISAANSAESLLAWYDIHRRVLPWRAPRKGKRADPYRVWLSEIMLQQTTVQAVASLLPQIPVALAGCEGAGGCAAGRCAGRLGRAWLLRPRPQPACRRQGRGARRWAANFPQPRKACARCRASAAIPPAAIAAIAYDEKQAAMDANAERVIAAALCRRRRRCPRPRRSCMRCAQALVPERAGDFAQALDGSGQRRSARPSGRPVRTVRGRRIARRASGASRNSLPVKAPKMRAAPEARRRLCGARRERRGAAGQAAGQGTCWRPCWSRRWGRGREDFPSTARSAETGAVRGGVEKAPRHRAPRLHPFRTGN